MRYVTTLMAATVQDFPIPLAATIRQAALDAGAETHIPPQWLGPAACDLLYDAEDVESVRNAIRASLAGQPIDIIDQETATRRKRLLVADMESTLIQQEMLDEMAELKGIRGEVSAVTARAMNGELDFRAALAERVALMEGLPISALHDLWRKVALVPDARYLVGTMRKNGGRAVLVSGGFTLFTAKLAEMLEFDAHHGNELEFERGALTGRLVPPIRDKDYKAEVLRTERDAGGYAVEEIVAVGDGANDIPMLMEAGLGVAYHAKPVVRDTARFRLDHADLTGLLYVQGYRREQFVSV